MSPLVVLGLAVFPSLAALQQAPPPSDPYRLPIGTPGETTLTPGSIVDMRTNRPATLESMLDAAEKSRVVYVGESHTTQAHHDMQASVIDGLARRGYDVIVGFEMFTRPVQSSLAPWSMGWWTEEQFIEGSDWKKQWGFDYSLYRPVFEMIRRHRLRMVALNVPRDWVRTVGRGGWDALSADQKSQLPAWTPPMARHKEVFESMVGGHPGMTEAQANNMRTAQCLWDIGMADSAVKYLQTSPTNRKTIFVVLAGSGHIMYDAGIPYRIAEYLGNPPKTTIVCIEGAGPTRVSRGLGDFVFMSKSVPEK